MARIAPTDIGRAFEIHSLRFLNHQLHMSLRRVGGAGDGGIDLRGWWHIPSDAQPLRPKTISIMTGHPIYAKSWEQPKIPEHREDEALAQDFTDGFEFGSPDRQDWRRLRVLAQCKAERRPLAAKTVRELEGVMGHFNGEYLSILSKAGRSKGGRSPGNKKMGLTVFRATSNTWSSPLQLLRRTHHPSSTRSSRHPPLPIRFLPRRHDPRLAIPFATHVDPLTRWSTGSRDAGWDEGSNGDWGRHENQ